MNEKPAKCATLLLRDRHLAGVFKLCSLDYLCGVTAGGPGSCFPSPSAQLKQGGGPASSESFNCQSSSTVPLYSCQNSRVCLCLLGLLHRKWRLLMSLFFCQVFVCYTFKCDQIYQWHRNGRFVSMLHSDLKVVTHWRLQAVGGKTVVLTNAEIQTLGDKTESWGAKWGTKTSSCKHCSNIILTRCYLLDFNLFCLAKTLYFKRGQKSDRP